MYKSSLSPIINIIVSSQNETREVGEGGGAIKGLEAHRSLKSKIFRVEKNAPKKSPIIKLMIICSQIQNKVFFLSKTKILIELTNEISGILQISFFSAKKMIFCFG